MGVETEVVVLKTVVSKLDASIEKITQVSGDIGKILAVHEQRLDSIEKVSDQRTEEIKDLHSRITTGNRGILDKLDELEKRMDIKMRENGLAAKEQHKAIQEEIQKDIKSVTDEVKAIDTRVDGLERWKWWIMGSSTAVGFIVGMTLDIAKVFLK